MVSMNMNSLKPVYVSAYDELGVPCTLAGEYLDRCGDLPTVPVE